MCNVALTSNLGLRTAEVAADLFGMDIHLRELWNYPHHAHSWTYSARGMFAGRR